MIQAGPKNQIFGLICCMSNSWYDSVFNLVLVVEKTQPILVAMLHSKWVLKLGVKLVKFIILLVRLCTYWHLLCNLSLVLAGSFPSFEWFEHILCIIHPVTLLLCMQKI